jgi:hypothetical protein
MGWVKTENFGKSDTMRFIASIRYAILPALMSIILLSKVTDAAYVSLQIATQLGQIRMILAQVGPLISAVLFILAGIFYALGQMLPPEKRAQFHSTSVNIIIGAIVVGVLSVTATSLATASTTLLNNATTTNTLG